MTAPSTAARYRDGYGPVVFGCTGPVPLLVRFNRHTGAVVIEADKIPEARITFGGDEGLRVLASLCVEHRRGRLFRAVVDLLDPQRGRPVWFDAVGDFYRCGRLLLERPAHQIGGAWLGSAAA